ncbi:MAG: ABC-2 transporter permease [Eubacteriales bacterium]|nr:ABC-2 transporter permease [Eubacteriales bacterium]
MIGLLYKDFYTLRQYGKTMLLMLILFSVISAGMDNPATFFEGFIILMSMMMTITSFSYDALAKWDRYALSMPITRKEIVTGKYLFCILLCSAAAILSFLISTVVLQFAPVEGFGMTAHLYATAAIISAALFFGGLLLPLIFQFGVEKSRIFLLAIFAAPTAAVIALDKIGLSMPSDSALFSFVKLLPFGMILFYLLSYFLSVRIYSSKEI